jgi:hypothetical protein
MTPTKVLNACTCPTCAGACKHKPGWFMPEEIAPLAESLGLSEKELFDQHLQVDWWEGDEDTDYEDVFVLSPAVVGGNVGDMFDGNPRGVCRWFAQGKCAIHELGKPFECAGYHHTDEVKGYETTIDPRHRQVAMAWNKPEHQKTVAALLGREPVRTGSWGLFHMLGM